MKHTPGPWNTVGPIVRSRLKDLADFRVGWTSKGDPNFEVPESEANARLCAAAPDMLQALRLLLDRIASGSGKNAIHLSAETYDAISAAIFKAEGTLNE